MCRTPSSAASEIGEAKRDDFTSPLQRLFDTARAKDKMENKEKPTKNCCNRKYCLVKSFLQRCLTKLATQNNQTKQKSVDL
jgi:hypothetical protein